MWFSSNQPDRPRRRVSHATLLACVALVVAALGIPATAVATASLVRTRDIANGAVTNPKIRNGAVGNIKIRNNAVGTHKIRNRAVTGAKVADNTLTGRTVNESTLQVTRIARRISGTQTVTAPSSGVSYRLANNTYTQPAHTIDAYLGSLRVRFPAGCTRSFGARFAAVLLRVNGNDYGTASVENRGTGQVTTEQGFTAIGPSGKFATSARQRRVTAEVIGYCGHGSTAQPRVLAVHVDVARFR